jgi:hypothetical protein
MKGKRFVIAAAVGFSLLAASAQATTSGVVLFKNGAALCAAYNWKSSDGFVGCSAKIYGTWKSVLLPAHGRTIRSNQAGNARSAYQNLGTHWRGGPFLCTVASGGIICVNSNTGHGFGINGGGITTR